MHGSRIAAAFVAAWLCAMPAAAQTAAEDEARIEELIRRERSWAGKAPANATRATTDAPEAVAAGGASAPTAAQLGDEASPAAAVATASAADGSEFADAAPPAEPTIFDAPVPGEPAGIALADLAAHTGEVVRVRSVGGRTHLGRIESVGSDGMTLRVRMAGGHASFEMSFAQIAKVTRP